MKKHLLFLILFLNSLLGFSQKSSLVEVNSGNYKIIGEHHVWSSKTHGKEIILYVYRKHDLTGHVEPIHLTMGGTDFGEIKDGYFYKFQISHSGEITIKVDREGEVVEHAYILYEGTVNYLRIKNNNGHPKLKMVHEDIGQYEVVNLTKGN